MLTESLPFSDVVTLLSPNHPLGIALIVAYGALALLLLYKDRFDLVQTSRNHLLWFGVLFLAGLLLARLFPVMVPFSLARLTLFSAAPLLLAAMLLSPAWAMLVGMGTGFLVGATTVGELFDLFHYGFVAYTAALLFKRPFANPPLSWINHPAVAGMLLLSGTAVFLGGSLFFNNLNNGFLPALDQATFVFSQLFWVRLIEGAISGLIVLLIIRMVPQLYFHQGISTPTGNQSLRQQLSRNLLLFSSVVTLLIVTTVYLLATTISRRLVLDQMEQVATIVASDLPPFYNRLPSLISALSENEQIVSGTVSERESALQDIFSTGQVYQRLALLVEGEETPIIFPTENAIPALSPQELAEANRLFANDQQKTSVVSNLEQTLSFMVPIQSSETGETSAVILGRVAPPTMNTLISGLNGRYRGSTGFIVSENNQIIAHEDESWLNQEWRPVENGRFFAVEPAGSQNGAYLTLNDQQQRALVYYLKGSDPAWTVVVETPYAVVLSQALSIGAPLLGLLVAISVITFLFVRFQADQVITPINEIVAASENMATRRNWTITPTLYQREDEIGQLSHSFLEMQRAVKKRLSELSLLLTVSQGVSSSMDLSHGMPPLLRGAKHGTGAAGVRAVILNPSGGKPLRFGEGALAGEMAAMDRLIMGKLRYEERIQLNNQREIRGMLELEKTAVLPIKAIYALALRPQDRFQGVIWFGYSEPYQLDTNERAFINALATQATLLVSNARLYANAEGGRRRLAAVLVSTSDPVVVTDPTDRIHIINPAMESLLGARLEDVRNLPVSDVINLPSLAKALTGNKEHLQNIELPLEDGRTFYANVSTIKGQDGQSFGRVAVLHDITHLKEIDELKSDFVQTVSHDLKNPLTFMSGYVSMMNVNHDLDEQRAYYLSKIEAGIHQMTELVTDLLDLGRIEAGVDIKHSEIHVPTLLRTIGDEYFQHAHQAGIKLQVQNGEDVGNVRGDLSLIKQAVTNLVTNGLKYAPNSGEMKLHSFTENGHVIISVKDNGPGIPEKEQIRLFEKFYRAKKPGTEKIKGSGLGLAIVKSIAERHGGSVGCVSEPGEGSTFYISLPNSAQTPPSQK